MRQPLVSVIVPTYNSSAYLEECLRSVRDQSYEDVELIVVDNNSKDQTKQLASRFADQVLNHGPERSAQRNQGVKVSRGSLLLIIDSDMILSREVIASCVSRYAEGHFKAIVVPERSFGQGFWAQCKQLERSFYIGVPWMEAARFFERKTFEECGGYDEDNTGTEDYDLPQRISFRYGPSVIGRVDDLIMHNEQRLSLLKTCKKKYYYAQRMNIYKSVPANSRNFSLQSNPIARYRLFFSQPRLLFRHPFTAFGMLIMKTCEFASAGAGYLVGQVRSNEKHT